MKLVKILNCIIFSSLLIACKSPKEELLDIEKLTFDVASRFVDFNELSDDIEIIPLKVPDSVFIGKIHSLRHYADYFLLHDKHYAQALYIFDREGNYINHLQRIGPGPGEYATIDSYMINNDVLTVYDRTSLNGIKYQLPHLNHLLTFSAESYLMDILSLDRHDFSIAISDEFLNRDMYLGIVFLNEEFKNIYNIPKPSGIIEASEKGNLSNNEEKTFYAQPFTETIYLLDSLGLLPLYQIDFGNKSLPKKAQHFIEAEELYKVLNENDYAFAVHNFNLYDSLISFNYYWKNINNIRMGIYDLRNDRAILLNDIGSLNDYLLHPLDVSQGYNMTILYPGEYDKELLTEVGATEDEIKTLGVSQPLIIRYRINKFPEP
ncbi:6-bladed beta-propeller [uncultured Cyclobacterium sp.]|uniref:6-bladed beta-propeller n=1 Tax=uncultured Cyclobacterium sp. TaxID=453820 RepID=UPI0030ECB262|tara:strand:+ start:88658 stop:89788 length:1131 start_codon:yes stop_codon:yes gene_type:complete